jgi:hypothetical protein
MNTNEIVCVCNSVQRKGEWSYSSTLSQRKALPEKLTVAELLSQFPVFYSTHPDQPWGPPSLLYSGYWVSFPGVKRPGRGVDHSPHLAPRLKKE